MYGKFVIVDEIVIKKEQSITSDFSQNVEICYIYEAFIFSSENVSKLMRCFQVH